tara:strand:- start:72 stop:293 length:222 start_codon:yes stop_codon:yes gene_type:complete
MLVWLLEDPPTSGWVIHKVSTNSLASARFAGVLTLAFEVHHGEEASTTARRQGEDVLTEVMDVPSLHLTLKPR